MLSSMRIPSATSMGLSIVVNVEEGAEQSILDGDRSPEPVDEMGLALKAGLRNYGNESNYQYGIKEGFGRVSRILEHYKVPATWTVAAVALERAPEIAKFIRERGDEAASHGHRWIHQFRMDEEQESQFMQDASDSIEKSVGVKPVGHLSRYLLTENTRNILAKKGFLYHMDDYSGDEPYWDLTVNGPIVVMPYAIDTNDMKMWHDAGYTAKDWYEYAVDTFDQFYRERQPGHRYMSLGLHLRIIGRPGRINYFDKFLAHATKHEDLWIAHRREIAQRFAAEVPPPSS